MNVPGTLPGLTLGFGITARTRVVGMAGGISLYQHGPQVPAEPAGMAQDPTSGVCWNLAWHQAHSTKGLGEGSEPPPLSR